MNVVCIIPSRYASTRLPGKPLLLMKKQLSLPGKPPLLTKKQLSLPRKPPLLTKKQLSLPGKLPLLPKKPLSLPGMKLLRLRASSPSLSILPPALVQQV